MVKSDMFDDLHFGQHKTKLRFGKINFYGIILNYLLDTDVIQLVQLYMTAYITVHHEGYLEYLCYAGILILLILRFYENRTITPIGNHSLNTEDLAHIFQIIPINILHEGSDTLAQSFWLNHFIRRVWKNLCKNLSKLHKKQENNMIVDFELGTEPIVIKKLVSRYRRDNYYDLITFDLQIVYYSTPDMFVQFKFMNRSFLRGGLKQLQLYGDLRLVLRFQRWFSYNEPLLMDIRWSFAQPPVIIKCKSTGILRIYSWLNLLNTTLINLFSAYFVLPHTAKLLLKIPEDCKRRVINFKRPKGLIHLDILEAEFLPAAYTDLSGCRRPNPYVVVTLGKEKFGSPTIIGTDFPWWNFSCSAPLTDFVNFNILIEINDNTYGAYPTAETVAQEFINTAEYMNDPTKNGQAHWRILSKTEKARMHLRVSCFQLSISEDILTSSLQLTSLGFPAGILAVWIDSAVGLTNFSREEETHLTGFNPFVSARLGHQIRETPTSDEKDAPIWETPFTFNVQNPDVQSIHFDLIAKTTTRKIVLGTVTIKLNELLVVSGLYLDKEYKIHGIIKNAYLHLVMAYQAIAHLNSFIDTYGKPSNAFGSFEKHDKSDDAGEAIKETAIKLKTIANLYCVVHLRFAWPKRKEFHVEVQRVTKIPSQLVQIKGQTLDVYVVLHLRDAHQVIQIKKTRAEKVHERGVLFNEAKIFEKLTKNIASFHMRISLHYKKSKVNVFNKIAENYVYLPSLSLGSEFNDETKFPVRLFLTEPFVTLLQRIYLDDDIYTNQDDEDKTKKEIPLSPDKGTINNYQIRKMSKSDDKSPPLADK